MLEADDTVFPNNAVLLLSEKAAEIDDDIVVLRRPLKKTDPIQAIGVFASQWVPDLRSYEMGNVLGGGRSEPTLQSYVISIQAMVQDGDEVRGLTTHAVLGKKIRDMLLRDPHVGVALAQLVHTESFNGTPVTERFKKRWINTQRYASNEVDGQWIYFTSLELLIETETA